MTYGGDHIPKSPFTVGVAPSLDLGKIKISGLDDSTAGGHGAGGGGTGGSPEGWGEHSDPLFEEVWVWGGGQSGSCVGNRGWGSLGGGFGMENPGVTWRPPFGGGAVSIRAGGNLGTP